MPEPTAQRWRVPWPVWALVALSACAGAFLLWLHADGDLRAADARARALGMAPTWGELGLAVSPSAQLAGYRRIGVLAAALSSYQEATNSWWLRPGVPLPPELAQHHQRQPAAELAELMACCDVQPTGLVLHASPAYDTRLPELDWQRGLCRLFAERIALAAPEAVAGEARRMLAVITAPRQQGLMQRLITISCLAIWQQAVAGRAHDAGVARAELADQADGARAWLAAGMAGVADDELRMWRDLLGRVHAGEPKASAEIEEYLDVPKWLRGYGLGRVWVRAGRATGLDLQLTAAAAWHAAPDYLGRQTAAMAMEKRIGAIPRWSPSCRIAGLMTYSGNLVNDYWLRSDVGLAVLAAELRGAPWPADPSDPAGHPVRRVERQGRLIGYYLLGRNQVDDGGKIKGDYCQALYERLGTKLASDPPPEP